MEIIEYQWKSRKIDEKSMKINEKSMKSPREPQTAPESARELQRVVEFNKNP